MKSLQLNSTPEWLERSIDRGTHSLSWAIDGFHDKAILAGFRPSKDGESSELIQEEPPRPKIRSRRSAHILHRECSRLPPAVWIGARGDIAPNRTAGRRVVGENIMYHRSRLFHLSQFARV